MNHWPELAIAASWIVVIVLAYYLTTKEYHPMSFFTKDLLERLVATFVQAFLGVVIVSGLDNIDVKAAATAGVAAALSLVKSLIAKRIGDPGDASLVSGTAEG